MKLRASAAKVKEPSVSDSSSVLSSQAGLPPKTTSSPSSGARPRFQLARSLQLAEPPLPVQIRVAALTGGKGSAASAAANAARHKRGRLERDVRPFVAARSPVHRMSWIWLVMAFSPS